MSALVGRLAPSPTGLLHLGHARSFLLAYWSVRARGGVLRLRIDDLDHTRSRPEFVSAALRDLEWLGLEWDGPVVAQSDHAPLYDEALATLRDRGLAYPCVCTRAEIASVMSAPHEDGARYPGTCRGRFDSIAEAERASGRKACLRLAVEDAQTTWHDELLGAQATNVAHDAGDFQLTSRAGHPSYQLAVVVDDAAQGVTEVLRGDDLRASTARQALLIEHLGLRRPRWIHVPLVQDANGHRLAKRHDALSLAALREGGTSARTIVAWAARSAGIDPQRAQSSAELAREFDLTRLPRDPVRLGSGEQADLAENAGE